MNEDPEPRLHGEETIIQSYLAPLAAGFPGAYGLLDDCAAITPTPGHDLIVKTDPVAAGIHFLANDAPEDIAWKALAVNVSDLAAKAAVPRAYLMALSFPEAPTVAWMARFARGLDEAQKAFGLHLIGGDTDRRPGPVSISITAFGEVPTGRMLRRASARAGDALYVTGTLGTAALGLQLRLDTQRSAMLGLDPAAVAASVDKYLHPQPRLAVRDCLRSFAGAAMDLSDGLAKDLGRMAAASGLGARIQLADLPLSAAMSTAIGADPSLWSAIVGGGDDYELLIAVSPEHADDFERQAGAAAAAATPAFNISRIGVLGADRGVSFVDRHGGPFHPARAGWDHF